MNIPKGLHCKSNKEVNELVPKGYVVIGFEGCWSLNHESDWQAKFLSPYGDYTGDCYVDPASPYRHAILRKVEP